LKLELVVIPVTDVDRAKNFYVENAGFNLDVDMSLGDDFRVVQLTPSGSACSIGIGKGISEAAPGSVQGLFLIVSDILASRAELVERGVTVDEVRHLESGEWVPGPDPERANYGSFADFKDPDGNGFVLQEVGQSEVGS